MEKKRVKRILVGLIIAFVTVFIARWCYNMFFSSYDVNIFVGGSVQSISYESPRKNIASEKYVQTDSVGKQVAIDQKYDKTANMAMQSKNFGETNRGIRSLVEAHNAVIQTENLSGLEGTQKLSMTIGVLPDAFDDLVEEIRGIAELRSFTVNKTDKTEEFRSLMAEIETLETSREAYQALQAQGGELQDLIMLQEKLLEIEGSLQAIGARAGLYASENSFCTVNVSLVESSMHTVSVANIMHHAMDSFLWTMALFGVALAIVVGLWMFAAVLNRLVSMAQGGARKMDADQDTTKEKNRKPDKE